MGFWLTIGIAFTVSVISYLIQPKPKFTRPDMVRDIEVPTAEAGRPIPKVFGTITVQGLNVLWYGDKSTRQYQIKV